MLGACAVVAVAAQRALPARGAGPRRGLGRSEPSAEVSPSPLSPREKWKRNWVCPERNRVGCFKMCLLRTWL